MAKASRGRVQKGAKKRRGGRWSDKRDKNITTGSARAEWQKNGEIWFGLADPSNPEVMPKNRDTETEQTKKDATEKLNEAYRAGRITIDWPETELARSLGHLGDKQVLLRMPIKEYSYFINLGYHIGAVRDLLLIEPLLLSLSFIDH